MPKINLDINVLEAAKERINFTFDNFDKVYLSFSGGKDSTAMLHLVMSEAVKRNIKIGLLFIDWECQFELTIEHIKELINLYKDNLDVYWTQFEIMTNNSTSMIEPTWKSWDESKKDLCNIQK
jgi:predicted phosphoadenosine phosphosulfate sulfurtransferase